MKTLPILAALLLSSSFAFADGCPNIAGKYINLQENADITIAQGEDAGVPYLSVSTPNASGGEDVTKYIVDGKEHEVVADDGSKGAYTITCAEGKLILSDRGSSVNDFHNGDGDDSQVPAVDPRMDAETQAVLTMLHNAIKNKQALEMSAENRMEMSVAGRDLQAKIVSKLTVKNLDTQEMKEFPSEVSGVMKRED